MGSIVRKIHAGSRENFLTNLLLHRGPILALFLILLFVFQRYVFVPKIIIILLILWGRHS